MEPDLEIQWLKGQLKAAQTTVTRQGHELAHLRYMRDTTRVNNRLIEKLERRIHALKTAVKIARRLDLVNARKTLRKWFECALVLYDLVEPAKLESLTEEQKNKMAILHSLSEIPF